MKKLAVIFDLDKTLLECESLEKLAEFLLSHLPAEKQDKILHEIVRITNLGMEGEIALEESIEKRMKLLPKIKEEDIKKTIQVCAAHITKGMPELINKLQNKGAWVGIVSGAPDFLAYPLAEKMGVPQERVRASVFKLKDNGEFDLKGSDILEDKSEAIKNLLPEHKEYKVVMVGDGASDLKTYQVIADEFIGFCQNVERHCLICHAPFIAYDAARVELFLEKIAGSASASSAAASAS